MKSKIAARVAWSAIQLITFGIAMIPEVIGMFIFCDIMWKMNVNENGFVFGIILALFILTPIGVLIYSLVINKIAKVINRK